MPGFSPRPKVADVVMLCGTVCMMGAPAAFPDINRAVGLTLFWVGLSGMLIYPIFRWGIHYASKTRFALSRSVSFNEAARIFYEAMERTGVDPVTEGAFSSPGVPLDHFRYAILSARKNGTIMLTGARLPSTQQLPISPDLIPQLMPSRTDPNGVSSVSRASPIDFRDVSLSRRDLRRAIKDRIALVERMNKALAQ